MYTVTAQRGKGNWWVLEEPTLGAVSQVRSLDQAEAEMREAIAYLAGLEPSQVQIKVEPILPDQYTRHAQAAISARTQARQANTLAAEESRSAARILREQGLTLRDIGAIMGVTHQRAAQLVN